VSKLLPDDASPGEIIAAGYFIEQKDFEVAEAWGIVCRTDARKQFADQLTELGKRIGRPASHIDGIKHALRFWMLSMNDPKLFGAWRGVCAEHKSFGGEVGGISLALLVWAYTDISQPMMRLADHCLQPPPCAWPEQPQPMQEVVFVGADAD
jgi:hypothetical protein